jgi:hypothetical protein
MKIVVIGGGGRVGGNVRRLHSATRAIQEG